jgi:hypothetical protein
MGLITGAGLLPLLDSVKKKLATEEVTDTERMLGLSRKKQKGFSTLGERTLK